jgi:hypothetical protein
MLCYDHSCRLSYSATCRAGFMKVGRRHRWMRRVWGMLISDRPSRMTVLTDRARQVDLKNRGTQAGIRRELEGAADTSATFSY